MAEKLVAKIALENTAYYYDKPYDYLIPDELVDIIKEGSRVTVKFGNSTRQGVVLDLAFQNEESFDIKLRYISELNDEEPLYSKEMLLLASWMKEHLFCTYFDAFKTMTVSGLQLSSIRLITKCDEFADEPMSFEENAVLLLLKDGPLSLEKIKKSVDFNVDEVIDTLRKKCAVQFIDEYKQKMGDATVRSVRILCEYDELPILTQKQQAVVDILAAEQGMSVKELCYYAGVGESVIKTLAKKGIVEIFDEEVYRRVVEDTQPTDNKSIVLNQEQQLAYDGLLNDYNSKAGKTALLYGVTGSGKTSIYMKLIDEAVKNGDNCIVMVPEISLTPQTLSIFKRRYGDNVAVFHSALSFGQRMDEYKRVKRGEVQIAIGTRSAVFAPFEKVGLIIMDEEQEHTYKSDKSPRFHARDIARFRAAYHKGLLVLVSATPSIDSLARAKNGRYSFYRVKNRYGKAILPTVITADMRNVTQNGSVSPFSDELKDAISQTLNKNEQVILLLNRRGYNTFVSCRSCNEVVSCPNCSISLTYHSANGRLMCHYCGYSEEYSSTCKSCGNEHIRYSGVGTQKAEEELKKLFPDAKVLRVDADTTMARHSHDRVFEDFSNGKYDILLGTQMVAKGLDFPNVTLVGVLNADSVMRAGDYKSYEKGFDLLTQVIGRSGRSGKKGTAIIQTVCPDDSLIQLAEKQDTEEFYENEIAERKLLTYPPFCDICLAGFTGQEEQLVKKAARYFFDCVKDAVDDEKFGKHSVMLLGPASAAVKKVGGKYRYRIIIKCKNNKNFRELLSYALAKTGQETRFKQVFAYIDVNPEIII